MPITREIEEALIEAVRDAGRAEIVPRFRALASDDILEKTSPHDLVTAADVEAEAALRKRIARILPEASVIGEEGVSKDPAELDQVALGGLNVVVDPVDGTWNFSRGLALFGTILAVIEDGRTIFGLLYDPLQDDWIEASLGGGAWHVRAGARERCEVQDPPALDEVTGTQHSYSLTREEWLASAAHYPDFGLMTLTRASVWDYRLLLTGGVHFCQNCTLNVWDHAAGVLALEEAGGVARLVDGRAYAPALRSGHLLCAAREALWSEVARRFAPALAPAE